MDLHEHNISTRTLTPAREPGENTASILTHTTSLCDASFFEIRLLISALENVN